MHHIFPTKFVYWEKIPNHNQIKEKYLNFVKIDSDKNGSLYRENIEKKWNCRCLSSYFAENSLPDELNNVDFIKSIVWKPMDNMFDELKKTLNIPIPKSSNICEIWFNRYKEGEWQEVHDHITHTSIRKEYSVYSGIYIMELNEKNTTTFLDKNSIRSWGKKTESHNFTTKHIEEGSVIIFPSELLHYVNPCVGERTTISFNITSIFE